jgi:hypothetical protein
MFVAKTVYHVKNRKEAINDKFMSVFYLCLSGHLDVRHSTLNVAINTVERTVRLMGFVFQQWKQQLKVVSQSEWGESRSSHIHECSIF